MKKNKNKTKVLVTGAGGFIGHHLVKFLKDKGYWVRGVDIVKPEFESTQADEFLLLDLQEKANALQACQNMDHVYALAADMGGMGFISKHHSRILHNNALINLHTVDAASKSGVSRYFYASSACIYPNYLQQKATVTPLKEKDAYPADPQDAYGWEKLVTEKLVEYYGQEHGLETRVARFHNIFGPLSKWEGGREKAPTAICRKVAYAKLTKNPEVEVWGDGQQTRSFCYIDDCLTGIYQLMMSDYDQPLNIGQDRLVTINELVEIVAEAAGIKVKKKHVKGPQGVRGRNSDNTKVKKVLGWKPQVSLEKGLQKTYRWVEKQVKQKLKKQES
ncbi:MAG: NAD-dependent epimerase/dehydratase family protein [Candidatus Pacebacteria bacterium]|nr:NAD-dependent epimerase/dehydratase family protein [Candidatus Paceibacterota bacterium]